MGIVYCKTQQHEKAFEHFIKAVKIHKDIKGEISLDYSDSLLNLAIAFKNLQDR